MVEAKKCFCAECGAEVIWKRTKENKPHPFNTNKTFAAVKGTDGHTHCVFVHVSHMASCPAKNPTN